MRQDFRREPYGNTFHSLSQKKREFYRKGYWFFISSVIRLLPFSGFRIKYHIKVKFGKTCFNITGSCRTVTGFTAGHCLYGSSGNDYFKFCFSGTTNTDSDAGVACTADGTCKSDYCDAELTTCANVCAKDSDCAPNEACRPSGVNTPYLRCVKKP